MKCEVPESSVYTATWMKRHAAANGSSTECGEAVQLKWKKISQSLSVTDTTWQEVLCVLAAWLQVNSPQSFLAHQLTVCLEKRSRLVSHITTLAASRLVIQSDRLSHLWGLHQEELCLICSKMTDRTSKKKQQSSVDYTFDGSLLSCQNERQSTVTFYLFVLYWPHVSF